MTATETVFESWARFMSVEEGFNIKRPELAPCSFDAERDRALSTQEPSGFILLDRSDVLRTPFPATSPLLLAKFVRIRAGGTLNARLTASGEIYYVIRGRGRTTQNGAKLYWGPGVFSACPAA